MTSSKPKNGPRMLRRRREREDWLERAMGYLCDQSSKYQHPTSSETPSSKYQHPTSSETPSSKPQIAGQAISVARFGVWCLLFLWILDLGAWSFCQLTLNTYQSVDRAAPSSRAAPCSRA